MPNDRDHDSILSNVDPDKYCIFKRILFDKDLIVLNMKNQFVERCATMFHHTPYLFALVVCVRIHLHTTFSYIQTYTEEMHQEECM